MLEKENKALKSSNHDFAKKIEIKFETVENKINMLKETVEEKNKNISSLEAKILNMESSFEAKLTKLEKHINNSENKFKWDKCKFKPTLKQD